jgi:hypothetical protein
MAHDRVRVVMGTLVTAVALATACVASAQTFDHLECYKIKDFQPKKKYTANLTPEQTQFLAQTGCEIKVPAKHLCIDVEKTNVVPAPPNVIGGQTTRNYLCYKLKCPKQEFPIQVEDQFGSRTVNVKKPDRLCAPAREVGFPDLPTPTPCLFPTPTPVGTPAPDCGDGEQNGGETDIDCGGPCVLDCGNGQGCLGNNDCQSGLCQSGVCQGCMPSV